MSWNSSNVHAGLPKTARSVTMEEEAPRDSLKRDNPQIEMNIFNSVHAVNIETFPGFKKNGIKHSYLEEYYA